MIDPTYLHNMVDGTVLVGFCTLAWKANRTLNRWIDVMREYPPHRHFNGRILYPSGMEPGRVEHINDGRGRA